MTLIHCLTCTASLTAPDITTANELAAVNNWLPVRIEGVDGSLCACASGRRENYLTMKNAAINKKVPAIKFK